MHPSSAARARKASKRDEGSSHTGNPTARKFRSAKCSAAIRPSCSKWSTTMGTPGSAGYGVVPMRTTRQPMRLRRLQSGSKSETAATTARVGTTLRGSSFSIKARSSTRQFRSRAAALILGRSELITGAVLDATSSNASPLRCGLVGDGASAFASSGVSRPACMIWYVRHSEHAVKTAEYISDMAIYVSP